MNEQISIFDYEREQNEVSETDKLFHEWIDLPAEKTVCEDDPLRPRVVSMLRCGFGLVWDGAFHQCHSLPHGKYIWLNEIESPEYWVLNDEGNPCGEHIESCPFCGADLKHGKGDVKLKKADGLCWKIKGYLRSDRE